MAKKADKNTQPTMGYYEVPANRFYVDERDMNSPYLQSYYAARSAKPVFVNKPTADAYMEKQEPQPVENKKAKKAKQPAKGQKKVKRNGFVILTLILVLLLVVYLVLSFVGIDAIADYTSIAVKVTLPEEEDAEAIVENIDLKDIVMGTVESFSKKSDDPEEAEAAEAVETETETEEEAVSEEEGFIYYSDRMANVAALDTAGKASAYGLPIGLLVFAITAVIFLIRLIVSAFTPKRRKLFIFSGIMLLIFGIVTDLFLYMWSAGTDFSKFGEFIYVFAQESTLTIQAGIGALVLVILPLLITITSIFCFRSKKKYGEYRRKS
ncbi:MAG TPA: hypothetical protein GX709_00155 [Clostridiales bacterium]|nr:hypothetical protein [Clostridiales bacterium]